MNNESKIKIPMSMFNNICDLLDRLEEYYNIDDDDIINQLKKQIKEKKEAIEKREAYTNYKKSKPHSDEREKARQQYLDNQGIDESFRTKREIPYDELH